MQASILRWASYLNFSHRVRFHRTARTFATIFASDQSIFHFPLIAANEAAVTVPLSFLLFQLLLHSSLESLELSVARAVSLVLQRLSGRSVPCHRASANDAAYNLQVVANGLEHPWTVAFVSTDLMLVTERPGRLRVIDQNGLREQPVGGMPPVFVSGQAGLFDVLPAQDYESSQHLYISYAHGDKDANHTRVIRAGFDGKQLHDVTPIFTSQPAKSGDAH